MSYENALVLYNQQFEIIFPLFSCAALNYVYYLDYMDTGYIHKNLTNPGNGAVSIRDCPFLRIRIPLGSGRFNTSFHWKSCNSTPLPWDQNLATRPPPPPQVPKVPEYLVFKEPKEFQRLRRRIRCKIGRFYLLKIYE